MILPYKLGVGGPIGDGAQYMPWIHLLDMVRGIVFLLETDHPSALTISVHLTPSLTQRSVKH